MKRSHGLNFGRVHFWNLVEFQIHLLSILTFALLSEVGDLAIEFLIVDSHGISAAEVQDDLGDLALLLLLLVLQTLLAGHGECVCVCTTDSCRMGGFFFFLFQRLYLVPRFGSAHNGWRRLQI